MEKRHKIKVQFLGKEKEEASSISFGVETPFIWSFYHFVIDNDS